MSQSIFFQQIYKVEEGLNSVKKIATDLINIRKNTSGLLSSIKPRDKFLKATPNIVKKLLEKVSKSSAQNYSYKEKNQYMV